MLFWILPLLILFGLIAAPAAAFAAATDAALLWWTRALPSLLPYLIAASLLERSGLFLRLPKRIAPLFLLLFGILGGYPVGARLAGRLYRDGAVSLSDAQKAASFVNQPNPVFLISVIAAGMFGDARAAAPLSIGVYGTALFGLLPLFRMQMQKPCLLPKTDPIRDLPEAIMDGMRAILSIGGCIVFASVLGALIEATGVFLLFGAGKDTARALLLGVTEMTSGTSAVAALPLSLPVRLALCAFFVEFGGLSVLLQSAGCFRLSLPRCLLTRFLLGTVAALLTASATPLFCTAAVPTMAGPQKIMHNMLDLVIVAASCGFGLLLVFVFTFVLPKQKRTP